MKDEQIFELLNKTTDTITEIKLAELKNLIWDHINFLLVNDFNKLIYLLYRFDIDEQRLKSLLAKNKETDSASLITELLIERQLQKAAQKKSFDPPGNIPDDEKW
ncbi:MAG TPA: hypothetical protein VGO09_05780 [Flavisolibacter sp.]|nr:hypothetical protein [Flavisolibacter sp.]